MLQLTTELFKAEGVFAGGLFIRSYFHFGWGDQEGKSIRTKNPACCTLPLGWVSPKLDENCHTILTECFRFELEHDPKYASYKDKPVALAKLMETNAVLKD